MKKNDDNLILPEDMHGMRLHFVGIKGTGMAALVEICLARGAVITGSDVEDRFYTDEILEKLGIIAKPFAAENVAGSNLVIYSSAYKLDVNSDLIEATRLGIPCVLYTEALGAVSKVSYSCGICGVHGKTTTTGLSGTIIGKLKLPAQILAGSVIKSFGDSCTLTEGHKYFIAETCEYQRHFMSFHPQKILLTSVESDHQDYYPTYGDILNAFVDFICLLPKNGQLIYCADDEGACEAANVAHLQRPDIKMIPYGEYAPGDYGIVFGKVESGRQYFRLSGFDTEFALCVPGKHTVRDAAGAIALSLEILKTEKSSNAKKHSSFEVEASARKNDNFETNIISQADIDAVKNALESFAGAKRRSEILGILDIPAKVSATSNIAQSCETASSETVAGESVPSETHRAGESASSDTDSSGKLFTIGISDDSTINTIFVDDYGHHPTAVKTTLEGYKTFYHDRVIIADFMSHTYTRTAALLEEFATSFGAADEVILHKIYASAREVYSGGVNGKILAARTEANHKNVKYFEEILDAKDYVIDRISQPLPKGKVGYLFVTMGAGDNWKLASAILEDYNKK